MGSPNPGLRSVKLRAFAGLEVDRGVRDLVRAHLERLVDLAAELVANEEEHDERREHDCKCDRRGGCDGDAGAEAHDSLSA